uniref:Dynein assembly factor with WD repeats 1 n=1 Tax=Pseudonaja textilis TaxID=8673 RepID=A0A670YQ61_PSETE
MYFRTDVEALVEDIRKAEPLITQSRKDQVVHLILRLQEKLGQVDHKFYLFKVLRAHILPLTNVAFNKSGSCFITGSYDRTCKLWDTATGEELRSLEGHRNVVYAIAFNNPYGYVTFQNPKYTCHIFLIICIEFYFGFLFCLIDKIATGSFDKTCKLWSVDTGKCHRAEISSAQFNWDCTLIITGSMDKTCMLWNALTGKRVATLTGHDDEVLDVCFDYTGQRIASASADGSNFYPKSGKAGRLNCSQNHRFIQRSIYLPLASSVCHIKFACKQTHKINSQHTMHVNIDFFIKKRATFTQNQAKQAD